MTSMVYAALDLIVERVIVLFLCKTSACFLSLLNFSKSSFFNLHYSSKSGSSLLKWVLDKRDKEAVNLSNRDFKRATFTF